MRGRCSGRHLAKIEASIWQSQKIAENICTDPEYPVFVNVRNHSQKTIKSVTVHFTAHLPHHSSNIVDGDQSLTWDDIIKPKGGLGRCYHFDVQQTYKDQADKAVFEVEVLYATFAD